MLMNVENEQKSEFNHPKCGYLPGRTSLVILGVRDVRQLSARIFPPILSLERPSRPHHVPLTAKTASQAMCTHLDDASSERVPQRSRRSRGGSVRRAHILRRLEGPPKREPDCLGLSYAS